MTRHHEVLSKGELAALYAGADRGESAHRDLLARLGPLRRPFSAFLRAERKLDPLPPAELVALFDGCADPRRGAADLARRLSLLSPGNGQVGFRQVNQLVDHCRALVRDVLAPRWGERSLLPHDHAFGSGGDFYKTGHATTAASVVVAPAVRMCKTGTTNVTSEHGSVHAVRAFGYDASALDVGELNRRLADWGFAFIPLGALGLPYSDALVAAREKLWARWVATVAPDRRQVSSDWQAMLRGTDIPIDIFKVVVPNAQPLDPRHHSTGVCHLSLLPYVLGIYLHLGTTGVILHSFDGIDELSTASSDPSPHVPNNLVVQVEADRVTIAEIGPEDLGVRRAELSEIVQESSLDREAAGFWRVVTGEERGARRDFIVTNAAAFLVAAGRVGTTGGPVEQLRAGVRAAERLIDSGASHRAFRGLLAGGGAREPRDDGGAGGVAPA